MPANLLQPQILTVAKSGALAAMLILVGCGGASDSANTPTVPPVDTSGLTDKYIIKAIVLSSNDIDGLLSGGDSVNVQFRVTDKQGGILSEVPLQVSVASDSGLVMTTSSTLTTDIQGVAQASISSGTEVNDIINHQATIIATVNDSSNIPVQVTTSIPISGTKVALTSSTTSLVKDSTVTITAIVVNGKGTAGRNIPVSLLNGAGVVIPNVASKKTDASGKAVFTVATNDLITSGSTSAIVQARINGIVPLITRTQASDNLLNFTVQQNGALTINSSSFSNIKIGQAQNITVQVTSNTALAGKTILLTTTRGQVSPTSATFAMGTGTTDSVNATVMSNSPGVANVAAALDGNSTTAAFEFISTVPNTISLQPVKSSVVTNSSTQVIARVRDVNDAPVKGAIVNFTITQDSSGGSISTGSATTDSSGEASTIYTAGPTSTNEGQVIISAEATGDGITASDTATLTVTGKSAYISLATSNSLGISGPTQEYYTLGYSATVTDVAAAPVENQPVSIRIQPKTFSQGTWSYDGDKDADGKPDSWKPHITNICVANDMSDTSITVATAAGVVQGNYTTNSSGEFSFVLRYGRNYATWVTYNLVATTTVETQQSQKIIQSSLAALAADLDDAGKVSPPFVSSPFNGQSCTPVLP